MNAYLIIGSGRLATHFENYLKLLHISYSTWSRNSNEPLPALAQNAERILLLISDSQIESFVHQHPFLLEKKLIHCSGALTFSFAESAHPLNTFSTELYDLQTYINTPFILEAGRAAFSDLLPGLPNPHFVISPEKKSLYHSLCVMSGNFTTLLWQNAFELFENELGLPREVLNSYLESTVQNLKKSGAQALTGPISRGDTHTLIRNLDALSDRPEQALYYAFLNFVLEKKKHIGDLKYERLGL